MASRSIPQAVIDAIITDWRMGQMSQREIAYKYKVSNGFVAKICKDREQDVAPLVSAAIDYKSKLYQHGEQVVSAVESHVDIVVSRLEYLNRQAMQNVQEAMDKGCENQSDFRSRALTINAAKETLVGKTPDMAVQINNSNTTDGIKEIRRTIIDPRHTDTEGLSPAAGEGAI